MSSLFLFFFSLKENGDVRTNEKHVRIREFTITRVNSVTPRSIDIQRSRGTRLYTANPLRGVSGLKRISRRNINEPTQHGNNNRRVIVNAALPRAVEAFLIMHKTRTATTAQKLYLLLSPIFAQEDGGENGEGEGGKGDLY